MNPMETLLIQKGHSRYDYINRQEPKRIINISDIGTWTSSIDYTDEYKKYKKNDIKPKAIKIALTKLDDLNIDASLFIPMRTQSVFDKFASNSNGIEKGTNILLAGAPGSGKTSVGCELISSIHEQGKKVLFISAEMNKVEMARYLQRFPRWGTIPMLFMSDCTDSENTKGAVEHVISQGWDLIFIDSFSELCSQVREENHGMSSSNVDKWLLDLMSVNNTGKNKSKRYTTFLTILQVGKSGQFIGSNKLKHAVTAMLHIELEGNGKRFMYFSKNRVGDVGKKLFFNLDNGLQFDEARYNIDLKNAIIAKDEQNSMNAEGSKFDELFGFNKVEVPGEVPVAV